MNYNIAYYSSPIGILEIKTSETSLLEITFKNENITPTSSKDNLSGIQKKCTQQLDQYFSGTLKEFNLPIYFNGTEFQQSVWNTLQKIPFGKTISYLTLSKQLGNVKAIRAVGTANGSNPIAIVVPCHRVIGSNGDLVGYAGELWRKKWLLEHEAKFAHGVQTLF